ncbi:hypothetical protein [Bdellovibrio sp. HCB274]|uniref:hypothetical protein n=1 Tax=Bdellovibrio sp. HCB274 TaxID=3394361 RepID=UPI0039B50804
MTTVCGTPDSPAYTKSHGINELPLQIAGPLIALKTAIMKNTVRFILYITLMLIPAFYAFAEEQGPQDSIETELVEKTLESAKVSDKDHTVIKLSESKVYTLDAYPDVELMKEALGLNVPEKVRAEILARGGKIENVNPLEAYEKMSDEHKKHFREMRLHFLTNAARILNSTKFAMGAGSLVGDGFSFVKVNVKKAFGKGAAVVEKEHLTFKQKSDRAVLNILKGMDYKLWSQAPLLIDSNEFGLSVSVGIVAETGVLKKGAGGAEEVGFSLAVNKQKKAFVFEIFHNSEKFDNTKAAVSVIGLVGKAGMTMGHREGAETLKGHSFYPPAIPGFSMNSPEYFAAGLSSSLGLPPPPLADLLTFTNKFERQALIRVTVSPVVKGFVRVQFGDVKGSFKAVTFRFVDMFKAIAYKVHLLKRPMMCSAVFSTAG